VATTWERLATFEGGSVSSLATAQAADGSWHVFAATAVGVFRSLDRGRSWAPLGVGRRVAGAEAVAASPRYAEDGLVYAGAHDGVYRLSSPDVAWEHLLSGSPVQCLALDAGDRAARPDGSGLTVFAGTREDGILVSRDGGRTWEGANAGLLDLCVYDLALSPSFGEDGIAFAAMLDGLYRTRNGAESWRQLDTGTDDQNFDAVAVSPTFPEDRQVLASGYNVGLFRSEDGGRTWTDIEEADGYMVTGVAYWSSEWAVAWSEMGVALSVDGGRTWTLDWDEEHSEGVEDVTRVVLLPSTAREPERLLAADAQAGVACSDDGGTTWRLCVHGLEGALISSIHLSPNFAADTTLYALSLQHGLMVSKDAGFHWSRREHSIAYVPDDREQIQAPGSEAATESPQLGIRALATTQTAKGERALIAATWARIHTSLDDGATWTPAWTDASFLGMESLPQQTVSVVATAPTLSGSHLLADLDPGRGQCSRIVGSRDGGQTWSEIPTPNTDALVLGLAMTPDAGLDGPLYVFSYTATGGAHTLWRSTDGGQRWQVWYVDPDLKGGLATPLVALPTNPGGDSVLFAAGNRVLRPRPNAWETKGGVRRPAWDTVQVPGHVSHLAASPAYARDRTLFVATSDGVFVSRDGGASLTCWSDGLEPSATVAVALSPGYADDRLVYALGLGGSIWRRLDR
jgi:photosystem II stability/assembly factor-like uncharacterized protein